MLPHRVRSLAHALVLVGCGVVAGVCAVWLEWAWPDVLEPLELRTVDLRFRFRPPLPVSHDPAQQQSDAVAVIDYDDHAAQAYQLGRWPWDRRVHAQVIGWLQRAGARDVLADLLFEQPASDPVQDRLLREATVQAGMVFYPLRFTTVPERDSRTVIPDSAVRFLLHPSVAGNGTLPGMGDGTWPLPGLLQTARGIGHILRTTDRDGALRRVPLVYATPQGFMPALALAAALHHLDVDPSTIRIERGRGLAFTPKGGAEIVIPMDTYGRTWINYAGPWGQRFAHYPYSWLRGQIEQADGAAQLPEWFGGKSVVLSNLNAGSGDQGPMPFEQDFVLSEMHAHLLSMIVTRQFLRDAHSSEAALCLVGPVSLVTGAALVGGPGVILPVFAFVLMGYLLVLQHAFAAYGVLLPAVVPLFAMSVGLVLLIVIRWFFVDRDRLRFLSALGSLLPPHTIRAIQRSPDRISQLLAGRRRELTMLFADLKDFSVFCQTADPMVVQRVLQEYRTALTDILRDHCGTLEKYTGDEVMAFFGDTEPETGDNLVEEAHVERQAANAVRAGLAIQRKMIELNEHWQRQGLEPHQVRIGLSTGPVMVGNFGTARFWQYGVVGSEVNRAKRIEGAAKPGGLLLGHRTYMLASNQGVLPKGLSPTSAMLKGFGEQTELYAVSPEQIARQ